MSRHYLVVGLCALSLAAGCNQVQSTFKSLTGSKTPDAPAGTPPAVNADTSNATGIVPLLTGSSGASEYDLAKGHFAEAQTFAQQWEAEQEAKGHHYKTAVGHAVIVGSPGQDEYATGVDLAIKSALLDADDQYVLQQGQNAVSDVINHYQFSRTGGAQAQAEAEQTCKDANASNLMPKLKEVANALADKAIQALGATPDHSTDIDSAIRCRYNLMVDRVVHAHKEARQLAIRGGRLLQIYPDNGNLDVVVAYGASGLEIADEVKNQRPSSAPNPNAVKEIRDWVKDNLLTQPDLLRQDGTRAFKMSNGEFVLVSTGVSGLPVPDGQMSDLEKRMRANSAFKSASSNALSHINYLAGRAVTTNVSETATSEENVSLETVIKDGIATAKVDKQKNTRESERDTNAASRMILQGVQIINQGVKDSDLAKQPIAYCIVAWSPSLLSQSQATISDLQKDHSLPDPATATPSAGQSKPAVDRPMKEDF